MFHLYIQQLSSYTVAKATLPVPVNTRPVYRAPFRSNHRTAAVAEICVHDMLEWGIIEETPKA